MVKDVQKIDGNGIAEIKIVDEDDANELLKVGWRILGQAIRPIFGYDEGWFSVKHYQRDAELVFTMGRPSSVEPMLEDEFVSDYVERLIKKSDGVANV